jgi:hypothetical protein
VTVTSYQPPEVARGSALCPAVWPAPTR